jgi:hypothetical protein
LGCAGFVVAIILTVVAAAIKDLRWLLLFAWPFAGVAVWEFARTWAHGTTVKSITAFGIIASALALSLIYWLLPAPTTVPVPRTVSGEIFSPNAKKPVAGLGEPVSSAIVAHEASRSRYQFSTVLWESDNFYIIKDDGSWLHLPERQWASSVTEPYCYNDQDGQHFFRFHGLIPKGLHSPRYGVCRYLENNPREWFLFGWMSWVCQLNDRGIELQTFDNGLVIRTLPIAPDNQEGQIFQLYYRNNSDHDSGKWSVEGTGPNTAPTCSAVDPPNFHG